MEEPTITITTDPAKMAKSTPDRIWGMLVSAFAPVASFVKARSVWQYILLIALFVGFVGLRTEIKAFVVTGILAAATATYGYIMRKLANPEFSVKALLGARDKDGNYLSELTLPRAIVLCALLLVQMGYTALVFAGVIYLLPAIYGKV